MLIIITIIIMLIINTIIIMIIINTIIITIYNYNFQKKNEITSLHIGVKYQSLLKRLVTETHATRYERTNQINMKV